MFRGIRWRIAIPYVLLILATMAGLGLYLSSLVRQVRLDDLQSELLAVARLGSLSLDRLRLDPDEDAFDQFAAEWAALLDVRVTVIGIDGTVLGESHEDRRQMDNHLLRPEVQQALEEGEGSTRRFSRTLGQEMLYVAVPVRNAQGVWGVLRLALPSRQVEASVAAFQRTISAVTLIATVLAVLLAAWIADRTSRPIRRLINAVDQMARGNLRGSQLPDVSEVRDEVGNLTRAINAMAVQLHAQFEALNTDRSKLAAVLREMNDGVMIVDEDGLVQLLNPAAERIFNTSEEEAIGRSVVEVLRHHELVELWRRCRETGEEETASVEVGQLSRALQVVANSMGDELPGSILLIFQDLTHLRRLETVRRDFVSNISHELRTPLASLKALTETLQEGALEDPQAARRFLTRMETEVDALTQMVQELLELTRIESGRVPLQLSPVAPSQLIHSTVERLRLQAERAGLSVNVQCEPDLPLVLADRPRIEQALVNLLHNAIKFTSSGGQIRLAAMRENGEVLFQVEDTGVGIPADDLPRIFERFYKADRARTGGGTGLGLAITRHMVEAHGGRIWAESVEGRGSTFSFTLPVVSSSTSQDLG